MRVWLEARSPAGRERVVVDTTHRSTMHQIWSAIAAELQLPSSGPLTMMGVGTVTDAQTVGDVDLRSGDVLSAAADVRGDQPLRGAALEVISGPAAGTRLALLSGSHDLGRDAACAYALTADPSVGRRHLRINIDVAAGRVTLADQGSRNGTFVNGRPLVGETDVGEGDVIGVGRSQLTVRTTHAYSRPSTSGYSGTVAFNRPPRSPRPQPDEDLVVDVPSPPRARTPLQLGAMILPAVMGVLFWQLFGQVYMLLFTLLTPAILIWTRVADVRSERTRSGTARRDFEALLAHVERRALNAWTDEIRRRHHDSPAPAVLVDAARGPSTPLWNCSVDDGEPPAVRIGCATQSSSIGIVISEGQQDLEAVARRTLERYRAIPDVPFLIELDGVVGLVGDRTLTGALAAWIGLELAATYSPAELAIGAIAGADVQRELDRLTWLPHTMSDVTHLSFPLLTSTSTASSRLLAELRQLTANRNSRESPVSEHPHVALIVDGSAVTERSQVSDLLDGSGTGVSMIWIAEHQNDLPRETRQFVVLADDGSFSYVDLRQALPTVIGITDVVPLELQDALARLISPIRDAAASSSATLPALVRLGEISGTELTPEAVVDSWQRSGASGLVAAIGQSAEGDVLVDIERDGPHGLIGGTTGAGKSELLQTLVASLALRYPPRRLNFLFIDYKGGSAFGACADLPHATGIVTDLDRALSQRALTALNAEVRRREHVIAEARCSDLAEMRARGAGDVPASLLIVVDEFATLASELPDFVDGIVDIARRGRSLGMHLILATQSPDQAISKSIQDNTNWRIALRVTSDAASVNVIGSPAAAEIDPRTAGRGVLKVAAGRPLVFQSAYVGAPAVVGESRVVVSRAPFGWMPSSRSLSDSVHGQSELDLLVETVRKAAVDHPPIHRPWVPALDQVVSVDELPPSDRGGVPIGLWDRPDLQRHDAFVLDFASMPVVTVYGGPASGKTTLLRTLAVECGLAVDDPTWVYAIDGGGGGLETIEALPVVGAVVHAADVDRVIRLISMLEGLAGERRAAQTERGVTRYQDLPVDIRPPRVVVMVDDYRGVNSSLERVDHGLHLDRLHRLASIGPSVGVHLVITATRRSDVPGTLAGITRHVIALPLPSLDEYAQLGVTLRSLPTQLPPGRAIVDNDQFVQIAVVGSDHSGIAQDLAIGELATKPRDAPSNNPPRLDVLGTRMSIAALPGAASRSAVPIGFSEDLRPVAVDLADIGLLVAGPPRSGRSTALVTIVTQLSPVASDLEFWLLAPRRTPLSTLDVWRRSALGSDQCDVAIAELDAHAEPGRVVLVVDDGEELVDSSQARTLEAIARRARHAGMLVIGAAEINSAHRAFASWISELRKVRSGLLLSPDLDVDGDLLATRLPRSTRRQFPQGRGYLVQGGVATLVHVASCAEP